MPVDAKTIVEVYVDEVLNQRDPAAASRLISNENFRQRTDTFLVAFPDLEVTVRHMIVEGNLVATSLSGTGTHARLFQGMPATGKRWSATCIALYRVEDGRIAEAWVNWDLLAILEQIGAVRRSEAASA